MKIYIDTNVVVARTVKGHIHHLRAAELIEQIQQQSWTAVISAHGLAEIYSALTGTPYQPRHSPSAVWQMLQDNILPVFEIASLTRNDYSRVLQYCAANGWTGGRIYDAIHIHTARKTDCRRIYTFNVQHFRQLAPDLLDRIMAP